MSYEIMYYEVDTSKDLSKEVCQYCGKSLTPEGLAIYTIEEYRKFDALKIEGVWIHKLCIMKMLDSFKKG